MSKKLKDRFELIVNEYAKKFAKKHGIEFDFWLCGDIGEFASFSEYYVFSCNEIRYDIDNDVPKGIILEYFESLQDESVKISYENYVRGLRPKHIIESERRELLERSKMNVERSKEVLENLIKE